MAPHTKSNTTELNTTTTTSASTTTMEPDVLASSTTAAAAPPSPVMSSSRRGKRKHDDDDDSSETPPLSPYTRMINRSVRSVIIEGAADQKEINMAKKRIRHMVSCDGRSCRAFTNAIATVLHEDYEAKMKTRNKNSLASSSSTASPPSPVMSSFRDKEMQEDDHSSSEKKPSPYTRMLNHSVRNAVIKGIVSQEEVNLSKKRLHHMISYDADNCRAVVNAIATVLYADYESKKSNNDDDDYDSVAEPDGQDLCAGYDKIFSGAYPSF